MLLRITLILVLAASATCAQPPAGNPTLVEMAKAAFNTTMDNIIKSAEKMPEENYAFKPVDGVRTFGQIVGHVANSVNSTCGAMKGTPSTAENVEKMTAKADIVAGIKAAKAGCEAVLADLSDTKTVKRGSREFPAIGVMYGMAGHNWEHYGNLVTYLRLKGLVPPSSEPREMKK